ncbi:MAG: DUF3037 domain-containing protein [Bryobacteraceae bacterium]
MPERNSFEYAAIRVVPRVDRAEFVNAGVIVFCLARNYLDARVEVNEARLQALWPDLDLDAIARHLSAIPAVCQGQGPIGQLSRRERFHWLVSPRSTVIQISPVHAGLCETPEAALDALFHQLVTLPCSQPKGNSKNSQK